VRVTTYCADMMFVECGALPDETNLNPMKRICNKINNQLVKVKVKSKVRCRAYVCGRLIPMIFSYATTLEAMLNGESSHGMVQDFTACPFDPFSRTFSFNMIQYV
jgi:hypothetical protein